MKPLWRFFFGGMLGLALGYALTLLFYPAVLSRRKKESALGRRSQRSS